LGTQQEPRTPGPADRLGPRPIGLHLGQAMASLLGALAALPAARAGDLPWPEELAAEAARLQRDLAAVPADELWLAVAAECVARLDAAMDGVEAYRAHPYRRSLPEPPAVWRRGTARLLDYGGGGRGAVLLIPSLVNRAHILDLTADRSLARWLAAGGIRTLLLDWGEPGPAERRFGLAGYVGRRLLPALAAAAGLAGGRLALAGYCMGGNLALAAALARPQAVAGLALLAAPWDFHRPAPLLPPALIPQRPLLRPLLDRLGPLPVDLLQAGFAGVDPVRSARKFRRFADLDPASPAAEAFVALEDWANDGVALAPRVALDCLIDWYRDNRPARGRWRLGRQPVEPAALTVPALVAAPQRDRLVPPASSLAILERLPAAEVLTGGSGHVGMLVGDDARQRIWQPMLAWLAALPR